MNKIIQITKFRIEDDTEEFYSYEEARDHLQTLEISKLFRDSPDYYPGVGILQITQWFIKNFTLTPKN
jgi:hypothetical protein